MSQASTRINYFRPPLPVAFAVVLYVLFAYLFLRVSPVVSLHFVGFLWFYVLLPGLSILSFFHLPFSSLETVCAACALGILLQVAVYFLLAPFSLTAWIPYLSAAICFSLFIRFLLVQKKEEGMRTIEDPASLPAVWFAAGLAALSFLILSAGNLTPDLVGANRYYHDLTNGIALIASASNGFPLEFLQMAYTKHYYHPFFYAFCAVIKRILGVSAFSAGTTFSLIAIAPLFAASFFALARQVFVRLQYAVLAAAGFFLFFQLMLYYIAVDLLGFSLGITFAVLSVLFFLKAEEAAAQNEIYSFNRMHLLSVLFLLGAEGAKGPVGVTTAFALCSVLLVDLLSKRQFVKRALSIALYAVPFFLLYSQIYKQGPESMQFRGSMMQSTRAPYEVLLAPSLSEPVRRLLLDFFYTVDNFRIPILCLLLILMALPFLKQNKRFLLLSLFGSLLGILFNCLFLQHGGSEAYFLYSALPFVYLAGAFSAVHLLRSLKKRFRSLFVLLLLLLSPVFFIEALHTARWIGDGIRHSAERSVFSVKPSPESLFTLPPGERNDTLSAEEYAGLLYIRDFTPKDSIIAEGRHLLNNKYFYGTAFSERRFFLEGFGYVTMEDSNRNTPEKIAREGILFGFFTLGDDSFIPLMRNNGITHIILYDNINPGRRLSGTFGERLLFENEHFALYEISSKDE